MSRYLLDTHVFLWWLDDPAILAPAARAALADAHHTVLVSAVSIAEIATKIAVGKLRAEGLHAGRITECRFRELPFTHAHAWAMRELPLLHRDPFDRMLVAQARAEGHTLVSRDAEIARYDVPILAA